MSHSNRVIPTPPPPPLKSRIDFQEHLAMAVFEK
jgi:hypothetical protein